ncbi:YqjF family protein [Actinoplanes sp. NPDC020271]|uniref:YqjF family protein n=1 Tax=Actinoplanes sp. NPDC020271 TaxID=3363896 RepID=UPI00379B547C
MDVEEITAETVRPVARAILGQRWTDLAFLHWAVDPDRVAPLLPPGTRPDTIDGVTYAGVIGFRMERVGFLGSPGVPYLGTFCETNVRLYSVDGQGRRAVVFRSLEAERLIPVLVARVSLRLPYMWARMRLTRRGDELAYVSERRWPGPRDATNRMRIRVGDPIAEPAPLEHFLTARWGLHTRAWGRTRHLANDHPRWPLHRAELLDLDDSLLAAAGLPGIDTPPASVLYSPGVPVIFGPSGGRSRHER